ISSCGTAPSGRAGIAKTSKSSIQRFWKTSLSESAMAFAHRTVLLEPAIDALLNPAFGQKTRAAGRQPDVGGGSADRLAGIYVDGTFGRGGHSRLLLRRLAPEARLIVFDKDPQAIDAARALGEHDARLHVIH